MYKTAEFVSPKHPDKICDQISDCILDYCLTDDPLSRVAVETMGKSNKIFIVGEVTTNVAITGGILLNLLRKNKLIDDTFEIESQLTQQSSDIAKGVDPGGAGDQGIMKGYAVNETGKLLPLEYTLARSLCEYIYDEYPYDGKTQITLNDNNKIETVVASFQNVSSKKLKLKIKNWLATMFEGNVKTHANPAGDWSLGSFDADAGLTGRKLLIDNYGPRFAIGGGAFSGKDPTKVDRSGAYMARKIAVDQLKKLGANSVEVTLAYVIGEKDPVQATMLIDGSKEEKITGYDLTPSGIIECLDLRKPQYLKTAKWGHFGNDFTWDN